MSARVLTSEQGRFGCSALRAYVHTTIAWKGEAYCIFRAACCVYSYLYASKLGRSQGTPCLRKFWRVPSAGTGVVTGRVSHPACSPVAAHVFWGEVWEFDGAGGTVQCLLVSVPESTPGHIYIISHHITYSLHRQQKHLTNWMFIP